MLNRMRDVLRLKHYAIRTETAYLEWARRFILFHDTRHPETMDTPEIAAFLTHLAVDGRVAASTQTQALSAVRFLYRFVLQIELDGAIDLVRAKKPVASRWCSRRPQSKPCDSIWRANIS